MENEENTSPIVLKSKTATTIQDALANIDLTRLKKDSRTSKEHGKISTTILPTKLVRVQLEQDGQGHGFVGCAKLSNGEMVSKDIIMAAHGLPEMPQLKGQGALSIDKEISTEGYDIPIVNKISLEAERNWMPVLIQMNAAIRVTPYEYIITRLARLKTIKPTHNMDVAQSEVFFTEIANMLTAEGFCYTAIDEGICELVRKEKDKWFPGPQKLIEYIYPIHWKMKRRADKLHEMLSRCHKQLT